MTPVDREAWVRDWARVIGRALHLETIAESADAEDGWRAEFLGHAHRPPLVLLLHHPAMAPYLSFECLVSGPPGLATVQDWEPLLAIAADHELAIWPSATRPGRLHLSARLPVRGLDPETAAFWIGNLVECRNRLLVALGSH